MNNIFLVFINITLKYFYRNSSKKVERSNASQMIPRELHRLESCLELILS